MFFSHLSVNSAGARRISTAVNTWRRSPSELQLIWGVKSGINVPEFIKLSFGCESVERDYVINGLLNGFRLGLGESGPFPPQRLWAESRCSPETCVRITDFLVSERTAGRIFGPFPDPPTGGHWDGAVVYPMCEVQRKDGKFRTISNLSHKSPLDSVNGFIPRAESATEYPSFEEIARSIVSIGLLVVVFALFDVQNAYRNLKVASSDWRFGIIGWRDLVTHAKQFWLDTCLVFGGRSGCRIYNRFGGVLAFVLRKFGFFPEADGVLAATQILQRYLDDHLLLCRSVTAVEAVLDRMLAIMVFLGVPVKDVKTIRSASEIIFLGYLWQPRYDLVTLDATRWASVEEQLATLIGMLLAGAANAQDVRCVTGILVWAAKVIPSGTVFTRGLHQVLRLYGATSLPASQARRVLILDRVRIQTAIDDLAWWLDLCIQFRSGADRSIGVSISGIANPKVWTEQDCSLVFWCDASGRGLGGFMAGDPVGTLWVFAELPHGLTLSWSKDKARRVVDPLTLLEQESVSSGYCEAAGLYLSLLSFLPIWSARHPGRAPGTGVLAYSDSKVVVDMWAAKGACDTLLPFLRVFAHLEAFYNITLVVTHIEGKKNTTADSISRQEWSRFRELQPGAERYSLPLPLVPTLFL